MNFLKRKTNRVALRIKDLQMVSLSKKQMRKIKGGTDSDIIVEDVIDL